jgi:hypothetical protein
MTLERTRAGRRGAVDSPELLISFLRYALDDVRTLSERSGRHLELAIATLAEDMSLIEITKTVGPSPMRQRS